MIKPRWAALAATLCCISSPGQAAPSFEEQVAAERLLGSADEQGWQNYLPFTRRLHAGGVVVGSLAASTEAAGVPPAAMIEALLALAAAIDPDRDVKAGDLFWVHYEKVYTVEGNQVGTGRVLWAELRTAARGTVVIHRFRIGRSKAEPFWLASGQSTERTSVRLPLDRISISSAFGLRADPLDQPTSRAWAMGPVRVAPAAQAKARSSNTLGKGNSTADAEARSTMTRAGALPPRLTSKLDERRFELVTITGASGLTNPALAKPSFTNEATGSSNVNVPSSPGLSITLSPASPSQAPAAQSQGTEARAVAPRAALVMHQGIDLVAGPGTPVLAAADGIVTGAAPNGGYGNWVEIAHEGKLASVYGHLSAFAPGIAPGERVQKGDLIGFVGNTGRSTGPHLHFELLSNGKPTNPVTHPLTKPSQLRGGDLERFRKVVAGDLAEAQREGKPK
jgi:murein DD-endopeptidase MepM/ murein hydrolase activator NlpD